MSEIELYERANIVFRESQDEQGISTTFSQLSRKLDCGIRYTIERTEDVGVVFRESETPV